MITIKKSPTADTRYCDFSKVSQEQLKQSTEQHIGDVKNAVAFFADKLQEQVAQHDFTKLSMLEDFHAAFKDGFKDKTWWDQHKLIERHHLTDENETIQEDVNLIDVFEYICDCACAGMARSGKVTEITINPELLQQAFKNTIQMLLSELKVEK
jgi:hypothetical protein